jgi:hypothetical protein
MVERKSSAFKSRFSRASKWLGRELGAALAAASGQDCATGTSLHALTETVSLCAAAGVRLERTLAHNHSPIEKFWESRWCRRRLIVAADSKRDNLSNLGQKQGYVQVILTDFQTIF